MRWFLVALACFINLAAAATAAPMAEHSGKDEAFISALIEALDDADVETRQNIALTLANLGEAATPGLLEALAHNKPERRMGAAFALGQIRPTAKDAVPALIKALKDPEPGVRRQVSYALSRMVGRDFVSAAPIRDRPPLVPAPEATPGPTANRGPQ